MPGYYTAPPSVLGGSSAGVLTGTFTGQIHDADTIEIPEIVVAEGDVVLEIVHRLTVVSIDDTGPDPAETTYDVSDNGDFAVGGWATRRIGHIDATAADDCPVAGTTANGGLYGVVPTFVFGGGFNGDIGTPGHFTGTVSVISNDGGGHAADPSVAITITLEVQARIVSF